MMSERTALEQDRYNDAPDLEPAIHTADGADFACMVEYFRTRLETRAALRPSSSEAWAGSGLTACVGGMLWDGPKFAMSIDQPIAQYAEDYGVPGVLRALATAIERHLAKVPRPSAECAE
jgi:hypothetical protein